MKYLLFLFMLAFCISCSAPQEPIYKRMGKVKTKVISTEKVALSAEAIFHNPNALGGEITSTNIEVIVNNVKAAHIVQDLSIAVPANSEFRLPLSCNVSPKDIYENDRKGTLGGIINAVLTKKADVQYKGEVKMKIAGVKFSLPIIYEDEVKF